MYRPPSAVVAMRNFVYGGASITRGSIVSSAVLKSHNLSALISRRWIAPLPETYARRTTPRTPAPTYLNPQSRATTRDSTGVTVTLVSSKTSGVATDYRVDFSFTQTGITPTNARIDFGDGYIWTSPAGGPFTVQHAYPGPGTYVSYGLLWSAIKAGSDSETVVLAGALLRTATAETDQTVPASAKSSKAKKHS